MDNGNILIVDDEKEIADLVGIYLENEGFSTVKLYESAKVIEEIKKRDVSLIILDIMMPGTDGLTLCRRIRGVANIPIIMLSAKAMDMDKVRGLTEGADDYITKPFNPIELIARVKAQIRRFTKLNTGEGLKNNDAIDINGLTIDRSTHTVYLFEKEIPLTNIEFEILYLLMSNAGKVLGTEAMFEAIWQEKYYQASTNTIMVHIRRIREKLGEDSKSPRFIKTVWGVGYKFEK